ncbi:hypothetical protein F2Q68_00035493 [Brassica cretica]|uniref:Uncharacterized protein n=1 Tax=Brassica cretica TaxID=69181 RepID=A0A8S9H682_BRACR|nr:hypothetical protein F2Q68_00035493 [Brassica cretica]
MSLSPSSRFSSVFRSSVSLFRDSSSVAVAQDPFKLILGSPNFGSWKGAISSAESLAPGPSADPSDYLVLAAHRTKRPDILTAFKPYIGGWNITNNLLGSAPGFILAAVWIWSFGSLLVVPLLQIESTRESQGIIIQFKKNLPNFTDSLYLCYCVIISNLPIRIHSLVVVVVPEIELVF